MNAQEQWKEAYRIWEDALYFHESDEANDVMTRYRREAALERKIEALQRRIIELEQHQTIYKWGNDG